MTKTLQSAFSLFSEQQSITPEHLRDILEELFSDQYNDLQIAAFLAAFSSFRLTKDHLLQAVLFLRSQMISVKAPIDTVDCCGTGGDASKLSGGSLNISTATAFFAAASGLKVAKHGNRSVSSQSGSADILEAINYPFYQNAREASEHLEKTGLTFLFAPYFHPCLKIVASVRKALKMKTMFNLLGPLLNPAHVKYQLIGVYDMAYAHMMLEVLKETGTQSAMIVHSSEGADELTLSGDNQIMYFLNQGDITQEIISPKKLGLPFYMPSDLVGGDINQNARHLRELFNGKQGAYRDTVLLNTGALLFIAGKVKSIQEGIIHAQQISHITIEK